MSRLRAAIVTWYRANRRDLPWRRTRDPYAIWVSEVMLQQTRVETVVPYYERFLRRFPTARSLAAAGEADVLAAWSGLGYYRRARNLARAAAVVVRDHGGRLPSDVASLRSLPGIGDYIAAAIASVAFGRPAAAVDGNALRVLARIGGWRGARDSAKLRAKVSELARRLAPGPSPGDWTQALMELGATVCTPRDPSCARCPVRRACAAFASGRPDRYPSASRRQPVKPERRVLLLARRGSRVLLVPDMENCGMAWTLPCARGSKGAARRLAAAHLGGCEVRGPVRVIRHRTYAHDLTYEVWEGTGAAVAGRPERIPTASSKAAARWAGAGDLAKLPLRAPTLKALRRP